MSEIDIGRCGPGALDHASDRSAAMKAVEFLSLAAAPTFAATALLSAVPGGGAPDALCSSAGGSVLGGMVPMYLLMSAFHSAPWLKRLALRRNRGRSPR